MYSVHSFYRVMSFSWSPCMQNWCMYACISYIYTCMCVRAHAYKCVNVCMSVSVPVCVSVCVCVSICVSVCLCKSFCLDACMGRFMCVWTHYIITNKPTESVSVLATKTLLFGIQLLDHMKPSFLKHASLSCAKALVSICLNSSVFFVFLFPLRTCQVTLSWWGHSSVRCPVREVSKAASTWFCLKLFRIDPR